MATKTDVPDYKSPMTSKIPPDQVQKGKILSARDAVRIIRDGDVVSTCGFIGTGFPERIAVELEKYFLETNSPRDLTLFYATGQGDGRERGLDHLAHDGLIKKVIGGHWGLTPKLQKMALENKIEAYNLPLGVITHIYRDIAAHKPRTLTSVGIGTFVDPTNGGGKINTKTTEDLVERVEFDGQMYLAYKTFPVNIAIIKGTTADTNGNITMEKEPMYGEALALATAAHNSGGFVIVQVERIARLGALNAKDVVIPGVMVDCVVEAEPEYHYQTFGTFYNPSYSCELKVPFRSLTPLPMNARKLIARRAAFELVPNAIVNLGIGMPEGVPNIANEEKILDSVILTAESGVIGGLPVAGLDFGAAINTQALIDQPAMFDFYDGGGLDMAFLGLAQTDAEGNLNVSRFGPKLAGAGGFINISQNAKKVVFVGTFTAGGLEISLQDGKLHIDQEGKSKKFIKEVEEITFSAEFAKAQKQPVFYVTERCVFSLTEDGLELIEVAPGIDIEKDILQQMEFRPIMKEPVALMDGRIFRPEPMGLKEDLFAVSMDKRLFFNPKENMLFVNLEGYSVRNNEHILAIKQSVTKICDPLGHRVYVIVNYDNFSIIPELIDDFVDAVNDLGKRYFTSVTRYTTSTFMRMKLGDALNERKMAPHIYETREEAENALRGKAA
jgi:propionate CoA-transferase